MESTCTGAADYGAIIYYSHLIPLAISFIVALFVMIKSKYSLLSQIFFSFTIVFCVWLFFDMIAWTSQDFNLIAAVWTPLDFLNTAFYLLALYFFLVFTHGKEIPLRRRIFLLILLLPSWYLSVSTTSIVGFDGANCEAINNDLSTAYKFALEIITALAIIAVSIYKYHVQKWDEFKRTFMLACALLLFFVVFSVTEFISSNTGYYELNLYSLFILPIFLFMIIYAFTNLKVITGQFSATQLLTYVMIILVGSQFFFLENATNQLLTVGTFILSLSFGVLLNKDAKLEFEQKKKIEKLAVELKSANERLIELDKQKSEFVSFATHQLKSPLAAMKGYASLILDGDYGDVNPQVRESVNRIYESSRTLANVVEEYLNISRIELGSMKYYLEDQDVKPIIEDVIGELKPNIEKTGITLSFDAKPDNYVASVDVDKIKQVFMNFIDNSVKYTPTGSVTVGLERKGDKILFKVSDTGIGMSQKTIDSLFLKFTRAYNANKTNIHGTGLGLYVAKQIVDAHGGKVWAESKGEGKGSVFYVELAGK